MPKLPSQTKTLERTRTGAPVVKHFTPREDGSLLTPKFRVSFPNVFEPRADLSGKLTYSIVMIFSPDTDFTALEDAIQLAIEDRWGKKTPPDLMLPILDGDESNREEYKGMFYINGKCGKYKPGLVGPDKAEIIDPGEFYAGCYARATINLYSWAHQMGKKGVSIGVRNIQKLEDGEPLISRVSADDDFADLDKFDDEI